ncbi:beta-glucosidase 6-like [Andrographis paniculata]|uniref:beta-glucosidase 6-like n=1 Tax=Andrographis paniculata TaxID=175694 RepID=UPI0021E70259|nr:beta-glucosidase 6-like [Andrographis paniculata]
MLIAILPSRLILTLSLLSVVIQTSSGLNITRSSFPKGFVFGTASSAYQYEGAVKEDGRGQTIWDTFAHSFGKVLDLSNADVATDHYHHYPEDIQLMKDLGMDAYRFSIAWSRIYPNGTGAINKAGIDHYNGLINSLIANGIEPYVTIYHWDLPQGLEDKYNGWLSPRSIQDFTLYAETCFKEFGDRVKHWITFNEPHTFAVEGYDAGIQAPSRCSTRLICGAGDSSTEPYIVGHNVLLTHAAVVDLYRKKYEASQRGSIGISLDTFWYEPASNTTAAIEATQRAIDFNLGWFLEPLITGDYPSTMRTRVGNRLPKFSPDQSRLVKGSYDFIGINHYTTWFANDANKGGGGSVADSGAFTLPIAIGKPVPERANSIWLFIVPHGMRSLMNYIKHKYGNPPVIITENGMDDPNNPLTPIKDALKDEKRIRYHNGYLTNLLAAIKEDGCNVGGYFAWSLLDNWEWTAGYTSRFGLYYVDFNDKSRKRYPKNSVMWFKNFLAS